MRSIGKKASMDYLLKIILPLIALLILIGLIVYFTRDRGGEAVSQTGSFLDALLGK